MALPKNSRLALTTTTTRTVHFQANRDLSVRWKSKGRHLLVGLGSREGQRGQVRRRGGRKGKEPGSLVLCSPVSPLSLCDKRRVDHLPALNEQANERVRGKNGERVGVRYGYCEGAYCHESPSFLVFCVHLHAVCRLQGVRGADGEGGKIEGGRGVVEQGRA